MLSTGGGVSPGIAFASVSRLIDIVAVPLPRRLRPVAPNPGTDSTDQPADPAASTAACIAAGPPSGGSAYSRRNVAGVAC